MIVSPPRSGSTITYQVLTQVIPSVYISNLHSLFPCKASEYMFKNNLFGRSLADFQNYYGYTSSFTDVNEGNEIVDAILSDGGDKKQIRENFLKFIRVMRATAEYPLIFKNVGAYSKILALHKAVPELYFLRMKREPEQVIQSVLHAYHELGYFNPTPPSLQGNNASDPVEFAVSQVLEIERIIEHQKTQINPINWLEWSYEDFCLDTGTMVTDLAQNYLGIDKSFLRKGATPKLNISRRSKVSEQEADRISQLLQEYSRAEKGRNINEA